MMLYTVTFPEYLAEKDAEGIEVWRQRHDAPQAKSVKGHVTLVFGTDALARDAFEAHVRRVAADTQPFSMTLAAPLIWPEAGAFLLFAVPEEGLAALMELHERLHEGPLAPTLRTDMPYVPHMTLGRCASHAEAAAARDGIRRGLPLRTEIRTLAILDATDRISQLARIPLGARS